MKWFIYIRSPGPALNVIKGLLCYKILLKKRVKRFSARAKRRTAKSKLTKETIYQVPIPTLLM